jgi:hypothetical protein
MQTAAPPGQLTQITFSADIDPGDGKALSAELSDLDEPISFSVEVEYSDVAGDQRMRTLMETKVHTRKGALATCRSTKGKPMSRSSYCIGKPRSQPILAIRLPTTRPKVVHRGLDSEATYYVSRADAERILPTHSSSGNEFRGELLRNEISCSRPAAGSSTMRRLPDSIAVVWMSSRRRSSSAHSLPSATQRPVPTGVNAYRDHKVTGFELLGGGEGRCPFLGRALTDPARSGRVEGACGDTAVLHVGTAA